MPGLDLNGRVTPQNYRAFANTFYEDSTEDYAVVVVGSTGVALGARHLSRPFFSLGARHLSPFPAR